MKTEQAENIIFAGGLSVSQLAILGVILTLLLGILFWRDMRLAQRRAVVPFLFLLRLLAVAGVLFALAEPTHLTEITTSQPKSFGIYLDNSSSMKLSDEPDGLGSTLRWSQLPEATPSRLADTWAARLGAIRIQLQQSLQVADAEVYSKIRKDAQQLRDDIEDDKKQVNRPELTTEILDFLDQQLIPELTQIASINNTASQRNETRTLLIEIAHQLTTVQRLGDQLAADLETQLIASGKLSGEKERLLNATSWLQNSRSTWLKDLQEKAEVRNFSFSSEVQPMANDVWSALAKDDSPQTAFTDLNKALLNIAQNYASGDIQGAVLITDGDHTSEDNTPLQIPGGLTTAPLFIVPVGGTLKQGDVILHHLSAPRYTRYTDTIPIEAMVTGIGYQGESAQIQLLRDDVVLSEKTITFSSKISDQRVDFSWKPGEVGNYNLRVEVELLNNEVNESNNASNIQVATVDDKQSIFIADDRPRWETRYLLNIFNRTQRIDHSSVLFEPVDPARQPPTLPYALKTWQNFDLVVLGDLTPRELTPQHQSALKEYVHFGGKLIVIAGKKSMPASFVDQPLMELLPVKVGPLSDPEKRGASLALSSEGKLSKMLQLEKDPETNNSLWPYFSHKLPVYDLSPFSVPKPTASVLIEARMNSGSSSNTSPRAYLSWHQYGKGMVAYLASPSTYHLRYRIGDRYHYRFWGQFLQWINAQNFAAGSQQVQIQTDQSIYPLGTTVHATLKLSDASGFPLSGEVCSIALMTEEGAQMESRAVESTEVLGTYQAAFENPPIGNYSVTPTGATVEKLLGADTAAATSIVILRPENRELDFGLCDLSTLRQIANTSNGILVSPAALPAALEQFSLSTAKTVRSARRPLWDVWPLLLMIIAFLSLEWMGRRAAGIL